MALLGHMSRKDLFNMFDEKERHEIEKVRATAISFTGTRSRLIKSNRNEFLWFEVQSVLQESLDYLSNHKVDVSCMSQAAMAAFVADAANKAAERQQAAAAALPGMEAQRPPAATEGGSGHDSTAVGGLGMGMGAGGTAKVDTRLSDARDGDGGCDGRTTGSRIAAGSGTAIPATKKLAITTAPSPSPKSAADAVAAESVFSPRATTAADAPPMALPSHPPLHSQHTHAHVRIISADRSAGSLSHMRPGSGSGENGSLYSRSTSNDAATSTQSLCFEDIFDEAALEDDEIDDGAGGQRMRRGRSRVNTSSFDAGAGAKSPVSACSPCTLYAQQVARERGDVSGGVMYSVTPSPSSEHGGDSNHIHIPVTAMQGLGVRGRHNSSGSSICDPDVSSSSWGYFTPGSLSSV
jgi:hypothetical protein